MIYKRDILQKKRKKGNTNNISSRATTPPAYLSHVVLRRSYHKSSCHTDSRLDFGLFGYIRIHIIILFSQFFFLLLLFDDGASFVLVLVRLLSGSCLSLSSLCHCLSSSLWYIRTILFHDENYIHKFSWIFLWWMRICVVGVSHWVFPFCRFWGLCLWWHRCGANKCFRSILTSLLHILFLHHTTNLPPFALSPTRRKNKLTNRKIKC